MKQIDIFQEASMSISPEKSKAVESAMSQIERQFGKGSIMKLGSRQVVDVPSIPSGSLALLIFTITLTRE